MSRVQSTSYNNENVMLNNCENYLNKMFRNKRLSERPRTATEARGTRDKSANRPNPNNQLPVSRAMAKVQQTQPVQCQAVRLEEPRIKPTAQGLVHKEVFNNNMATVEVTVRTVSQKGSDAKGNSEEVREPWSKILTTRRSEENMPCTFGNFDPLRTLHFLSKELQLKLQNLCPGDPGVHQIVYDMQNVMQRLPREVVSQLKTSTAYCFPNINNGDSEPPTNLKKSNYYDGRKVSSQTQTVIMGNFETRKMQQQLEESALKFEASCKDMENSCKKLRTENEELENMLLKERETVILLKKELHERASEKDEYRNKEIYKIIAERDELKNQVHELQTKVESQVDQTSEDLRSLVEEIRNKQLTAEQENTARQHELTMMKLEREKMNVLLECRDKQLRELRNELECIQQLVSTQLLEFKSNARPTFSAASTNMSSVSQLWNIPSKTRTQTAGTSIHDLFLNNDVMRKMLLSKELQQIESGTITTVNVDEIMKEQNLQFQKLQNECDEDSPQQEKSEIKLTSKMTTSDIRTETEFIHKLSSPSIRDMFAKIRREAFKKLNVNLTPPLHKNKDTTTTEAESQDGRGSHVSVSS